MIKAVLWDIDGTLLDFEKAEEFAIKAGFKRFGLGECSEAMLEEYKKINSNYWQKLERGEIAKSELLWRRFSDFFETYGLNTSCSKDFNEYYQLSLGDFAFFNEGGLETVEALKGLVLQCAVTNGTKVAQDGKLKKSGLDKLLDHIYISETMGVAKPDVRFFEAIFKELGAGEYLIVGDSLSSDIQGGKNAGIHTCLYDKYGHFSDEVAEFRIESLSEVIELVRKLWR